MSRRIRRLGACVLAAGVVLTCFAVSAPAKPANGCTLVAPLELEAVFERPFANGKAVAGGACEFRRDPEATQFDMVVVRVLAEKYASVAKAKKGFARAKDLTTELALVATPVDGVGDEAFTSYLIGTDQLTFRAGKTVVEVRVDNEDDEEARYADVIAAVGFALASHVGAPVVPTTTTTEAAG